MRSITFIVAVFFGIGVSATSLAQDERLRDARNQLQNDLRNGDIGAGYAQMLNFFVDPSISASRLDADDGVRYDVFKVPLQYEFPPAEGGWRIAVRGTLSHASAEDNFRLFQDEVVKGTWEADSALLGVGVLVPAGERLTWFVGGQYGISRLENEADYTGPVTRELIAPVVDGVLFNWDTNARIASLTGGLDYKTTLADRYPLDLTARYTYSQIDSYSESRDLQSFSEDAGTVSASAQLEHPYTASLWERPLFGVAQLGVTAFTGPNRDALGFNHFYSLGYSVGIDVSQQSRYFDGFTLGGQLNIGPDVDGFSIVFGWRLK